MKSTYPGLLQGMLDLLCHMCNASCNDQSDVTQVTWDERHGGYTAGKLEEIFERHGEVSDIVMRQQGKRKSKASAFVEMATLEGAAAAAKAQNGRPDAPLLVVPFNKVKVCLCSGEEYQDVKA